MNRAESETPDDLQKLQHSAQSLASWQNAQQHLVAGRNGPALTVYRTLTQRFPGVCQLWAEMSIAAAGELDFPLAVKTAQRAAELARGDAATLVSIGQQFHRLRRLDEARACFEKAVAAEPASVHAQLSLAAWLERERRLDDAWNCVETSLRAHPADGHALYFKAFLLHRKGLNSDAEAALRDLLRNNSLDADVKYSANHLLGVVLDSMRQYDEAIRQLQLAKAQLRQVTDVAGLERNYDQMERARRELLAALTPGMIKQWRDEAAVTPSSHPLAFLGGPPRSGTTLIEQILGAHPGVLVFDEPEAFTQEIYASLNPPPPGRTLTARSLNNLGAAQRTPLMGRYFKSLLREQAGLPGGKLLLDKNPSLTAALYLWLRIFPQLKVIIALRDPRDIVVSCFFQNLALTTTNVNFLSLERTARYYADCMDVWLRLRELGGFDWMETRYEDFVGNLETEGRRVTGFLGLPWDSAQAKYHETARRTFVFAPTYNEVTKPVYSRAVGRWEHYAAALAPVEGILGKYCREFRYTG